MEQKFGAFGSFHLPDSTCKLMHLHLSPNAVSVLHHEASKMRLLEFQCRAHAMHCFQMWCYYQSCFPSFFPMIASLGSPFIILWAAYSQCYVFLYCVDFTSAHLLFLHSVKLVNKIMLIKCTNSTQQSMFREILSLAFIFYWITMQVMGFFLSFFSKCIYFVASVRTLDLC